MWNENIALQMNSEAKTCILRCMKESWGFVWLSKKSCVVIPFSTATQSLPPPLLLEPFTFFIWPLPLPLPRPLFDFIFFLAFFALLPLPYLLSLELSFVRVPLLRPLVDRLLEMDLDDAELLMLLIVGCFWEFAPLDLLDDGDFKELPVSLANECFLERDPFDKSELPSPLLLDGLLERDPYFPLVDVEIPLKEEDPFDKELPLLLEGARIDREVPFPLLLS